MDPQGAGPAALSFTPPAFVFTTQESGERSSCHVCVLGGRRDEGQRGGEACVSTLRFPQHLLISPWPELDHVTTLSCKGGWEMRSFLGLH